MTTGPSNFPSWYRPAVPGVALRPGVGLGIAVSGMHAASSDAPPAAADSFSNSRRRNHRSDISFSSLYRSTDGVTWDRACHDVGNVVDGLELREQTLELRDLSIREVGLATPVQPGGPVALRVRAKRPLVLVRAAVAEREPDPCVREGSSLLESERHLRQCAADVGIIKLCRRGLIRRTAVRQERRELHAQRVSDLAPCHVGHLDRRLDELEASTEVFTERHDEALNVIAGGRCASQQLLRVLEREDVTGAPRKALRRGSHDRVLMTEGSECVVEGGHGGVEVGREQSVWTLDRA